jgi:cyanophycin synthetase
MRNALKGKRIILFSAHAGNPAIQEHVRSGGSAYVIATTEHTEWIVRQEVEGEIPIVDIKDLPVTLKGIARHNSENALAAFAAVHCLGISDRTACESARQFRSDVANNPGRLNQVLGFDFDLIFDYAHNKHGFAALAEFVSKRNRTGRNICVVTMPAVRITDEVAWDAMKALAGHFEHFITCNNDLPEYRRDGFPEVLQRGLVAAGVREEKITVRDSVDEAIETSLGMARPGDLVLVLAGQDPERLIVRMREFEARAKEGFVQLT